MVPSFTVLLCNTYLLYQIKEISGVGDTFDVSWSNDGEMLCSCFSSGTINIMFLGDAKKTTALEDVTGKAPLPESAGDDADVPATSDMVEE